MTSLFFRFYLGVILILVVAWAGQNWLGRLFSSPESRPNLEPVIRGGARLALESYVEAQESEASLDYLQSRFDYPVEVIDAGRLTPAALVEFEKGHDVDVYPDKGLYYAMILPSGDRALRFGPLPRFGGSDETPVLLSLGSLLTLVAGAIALLLRPVNRQLKLLESTATAIADGNFSARVDERRVTSARTLARAMNGMAGRIESLLNTQREMLQAVSHELRTPLARIRFASDLLQNKKDEENRAVRFEALETATTELDELVEELLHYVRWETAATVIDGECELLPLIENAVTKYSGLHPAKRIEFGENLASGGVAIRGDRRALDRAMSNVIANACRFATTRVLVDCSVSTDDLRIDADDDGPGIPLADRDKIFEPFVRLDDAARGAGLGLTLVRRIVGHYGGTVTALDSPLGGCRIRISIPVDRICTA